MLVAEFVRIRMSSPERLKSDDFSYGLSGTSTQSSAIRWKLTIESSSQRSKGPLMKLHALQSWMQAVVTHPLGIEAGIECDAAQATAPIDISEIESVIGRSRSLGSVDRLAVYGNAYFARLLDCLADEFPTTKRVLGDDAFHSIALQYLHARPSRSYTLHDLGTGFPQYLRETRPADVAHPGWPDYVIDLATLERTYSEVFDGLGIEDLHEGTSDAAYEPLTPTVLQSLAPDEIPRLRLHPAPCLRLLELDFPVHEAITAARQDRDISPPEAAPTFLVVTRREFIVRRVAVTEIEYRLLKVLVDGARLGDAITQVAMTNSSISPAFISDCFERWSQARWFIGLSRSA